LASDGGVVMCTLRVDSVRQGCQATAFSARRSEHRCQPDHSEEIVSRGRRFTLLFELPSTDESRTGQAAHRFAPTEDFLDTFANTLTHTIAFRSLASSPTSSRCGCPIHAGVSQNWVMGTPAGG